MIFETERLLFREMNRDDIPDLSRILQDKEVMKAYEHAFSESEVWEWLLNQQRRYQEDGFGLWAAILKKSGRMIGQCGLTLQRWDGKKVPEIGYLFCKEYWHQGYAIESAQGCKKYAFEQLELEEVYSIIRDTNFDSIRVAQKNGMEFRGRTEKFYYGIHMPHFVYSVKRP